MQKTAQKRSLLSQLREKINIPGAYLEGFFKPELDRVMSALKQLDDKVRAELTGTKIGTAEAPASSVSAKNLLKSARTNFNRREYMAGLADLGLFHKKMYDITREIDKFYVDVNKIHNKFLFEGLDEKQREKLKSLREHMERKARMELTEQLIKEAGIMDFFYNIGTKRGRSLMAWEKKYPNKTKELREWGNRLIDSADDLLAKTISYLKQMATARAIRRPDDYMEAANKIKGDFERFDGGDKGFRAYYTNVVVPYLKINDEIEAKEQAAAPTPVTPAGPPAGKVELGAPPSVPPAPPAPPAPPGAPQSQISAPFSGAPQMGSGYITVGPGPSPTEPKEDEGPPTEREPAKIPPGAKVRVAHQQFIESLESMSKEDPRILAGYISKYASSIQSEDPEVAISLFALAHQIKG